MPSLLSSNYLARRPIDYAMKRFARNYSATSKILDIGCGHKPYAKYFSGTYTGIDHEATPEADIVCDSAAIPLPDEAFDAVILNQTLEHTEKLEGTISEIRRLLKPGGHCFVSVPMAMKVHSVPLPSKASGYTNFQYGDHPTWNVDFWRFTKFGLIVRFKDFEVISLRETSGYFGTLRQLSNYFFASFGVPYVFIPIYVVNNCIGIVSDTLIEALCGYIPVPTLKKFYRLIYQSLPLNYNLIVRKPL